MSFQSQQYWETRYATGGFSGAGSRGDAAIFKASVVNELLNVFGVESILDMGCGDGYLTRLIQSDDYIGADVSASAIASCRAQFPNKRFIKIDGSALPRVDAVLSLDVVFHLTEDAIFERYMYDVFSSAQKLVVFYSTDHDDNIGSAPHVRHRHFTQWVQQHISGWRLHHKIESPIDDRISAADFFVFSSF